MSWVYVIGITGMFLGLYLQFAAFVGGLLREASGCLCRKGAVNMECPVHGRRA